VRQSVRTFRWRALFAALLCMGSAAAADTTPPAPATTAPALRDRAPESVGATVCAECHRSQYDAWRGSHHALAMQEASKATVLGNFNHARFTYGGVTSTFFTRDGKFYVNTDGPDGTLHDYEIRYTFGIAPLQQYLIPFPDGRLQALNVCWDTRPKQQGGQRWFHLYPNEVVDFRDALHWTGPYQNWNYMCSECHSTNVRKNYNPDTDRFATTWSEIDVACEACHGPGARHVEWSRQAPEGHAPADPTKGLAVDLAARGGAWMFEGSAPIAHLSGPRDTHPQVICARCHARRTQMGEDYDYSQALGQTHMLALLDARLYHADGQILDEVFEYGSFLQSRMHERGVVCADCHDPHSGRLRADGNAVCAKCHQPSQYDTAAHHHHKPGTAAARCVQCHMLARNYMVVHTRHDHSFRVPRPDLSVTLGTPDTCTDCHHDHPAQWSADAVARWYGPTRTRGPRYAAALAAGRRRQAGAERLLADVIADRSYPAIVRATAVSLLENFPGSTPAALIERAVQDEDPIVRRAAVALLVTWEPQRRWQLGAPLLNDPIRVVRIAAVNALAGTSPAEPLNAAQRAVFERAVAEYRALQRFNADRAEAWLNLGALDVRLGNVAPAEADYQRAIRMQPVFIPPYVNLADLYREQNRDADGERVLRQALTMHPPNGDVDHALGLLLVRQKRTAEAISELAKAAAHSPENPRFAYVYGVALDSVGQQEAARTVLAQAHERFSGDRDIVSALLQFSLQANDQEAAATWAQALRQLQENGAK
jgi:predicted CXXCH cytochrome family protein